MPKAGEPAVPNPMKILTIHNRYKIRGGEDESRESEDAILIARGHQFDQIIFDNTLIQPGNLVRTGIQTSWSQSAYNRVRQRIVDWKPDIMDIHNFFPLASPAVHHAAYRLGVPVIQTLHNYRLLCPGATFYRNGTVCEDCARHWAPWPAVLHSCYRESALGTSAVAAMIVLHRLLRTWKRTVATFIVVSEFAKQKFVAQGFQASRMAVKPNFVLDPGPPGIGGDGFLFVGRLSVEKGIRTMLQAMELVNPAVRLKIVGDGPLAAEVSAAAECNPRIQYVGRLPLRQVLDAMGASRCVLFPSEWYETFGRIAAESFAKGTPVIASRIGAVAEIVDDGRTGFHYRTGDPQDLARAIDRAFARADGLADMRTAARLEYEQKYTAERNYRMLMDIYEGAIAARTGHQLAVA
jgi:glycosyltransferase involved in cell wall biosynthesis